MAPLRGVALPAQGARPLPGRQPGRVHRRVHPRNGAPLPGGAPRHGGPREGRHREPGRGAHGWPLLAQGLLARTHPLPQNAD